MGGDESAVAHGTAARQGGGFVGWWRRWRAARAGSEARNKVAWSLYHDAVGRARDLAFYAHEGVPDTPDGRFELVATHTALVCRRLSALGPQGRALAVAVTETMVDDMDRSVRELGVGDLSVGKWVKRMAQSLLARIAALDAAVPPRDRAAVAEMLRRNLGGIAVPYNTRLEAAADRILAFAAELDATPPDALLNGHLPSHVGPGAVGGSNAPGAGPERPRAAAG